MNKVDVVDLVVELVDVYLDVSLVDVDLDVDHVDVDPDVYTIGCVTTVQFAFSGYNNSR